MTDPTIIAAAIVTVIAALVAGVVTVVNAVSSAAERRDAREDREVTKAVSHKADIIIEKAAEIHTLTNSNLSKVTSQLEVAMSKMEGLQKLVTSMSEAKAIADTLATRKVTNSTAEGLKHDTILDAGVPVEDLRVVVDEPPKE